MVALKNSYHTTIWDTKRNNFTDKDDDACDDVIVLLFVIVVAFVSFDNAG